MSDDVFMSILPRHTGYINNAETGIPLRVIRGGVDYKPNIKFNISTLNDGSKVFQNNSGWDGDSFDIKILVHSEDRINGVKVFKALNHYIRRAIPFYINTKAVGIKSTDLWLITENKTRTQNYKDGYVEWDLTFTKYTDVVYATFKNTNEAVRKAIRVYNRAKEREKEKAKKEEEAKKKTTARYRLEHECKADNLKYSEKKKNVKCVGYMQKILYNKGCFKNNTMSQVDGWYGKVTVEAVKTFQKKYQKKYNLKVTGKVDKNTFNAFLKV